jgi:hypothetical protein
MWGIGIWIKVGVLIHPTGVLWDSDQDSGLASPFLEPIVHKPVPYRFCFMTGSIVMLIQTTVITKLVFYIRQHAMGQNILYPPAFRFPCSITRGPSPFHEKHPYTVMPPPPNFTVGTTHAGRYRSPSIRHTQTLASDCHMV